MRDNYERAEAASAALQAYTDTNTRQYADEPMDERIADLICDLLHLAGQSVDFETGRIDGPVGMLETARMNFEEEEEEQEEQEEEEAIL